MQPGKNVRGKELRFFRFQRQRKRTEDKSELRNRPAERPALLWSRDKASQDGRNDMTQIKVDKQEALEDTPVMK